MKRVALTIALLFGALCASAQQNIVVTKPAGPQEMPGIYSPNSVPATSVLALPDDNTPAYQSINIGRPFTKSVTMDNKRMLAPGESVIIAVENDTITDDSTHIQLSSTIESAIARVPVWMQYDLRFKFRRMTRHAWCR